jgi:hypothetical protein
MKPYLATTGTIFGLVGAVHLLTLLRGWQTVATNPSFGLENGILGALSAALPIWAFRLLCTRTAS